MRLQREEQDSWAGSSFRLHVEPEAVASGLVASASHRPLRTAGQGEEAAACDPSPVERTLTSRSQVLSRCPGRPERQ